jgi:membrane fusion protein (multidrug efflux system)
VRLKGAIRPNAIMIPQRAVQQGAKGHFVWVVNKDNQAEARPITVGEWKGDDWLIDEGLENGEQVVVDGGIRLTQGAAVKASPYVPTTTAATAKAGAGAAASPRGAAAPPSNASIYFPSGQATLDTGAQRAVRVAAAAYVGIGTQILITGYADKNGNAASNVDLAKRRAAAVRDELVHLGVEPRRIVLAPPATVTGSGSDDEARRVDIAVTR